MQNDAELSEELIALSYEIVGENEPIELVFAHYQINGVTICVFKTAFGATLCGN